MSFLSFFKLLQWVKDRTNETEENRHRIGENLAEAEALSADLQELEARLKVCVARNALFGEDGRVHRDLTAYTLVDKYKSLPKQAVAVTKVMWDGSCRNRSCHIPRNCWLAKNANWKMTSFSIQSFRPVSSILG